MTDPQVDPFLNPTYRDALRKELVHRVATTTVRRPARSWTRRRTLTLSTVLLIALGGGGTAMATGFLPLPGADRVELRAPASTVVRTGTATVDLGERPSETTSIELSLTCLTPGTFTFADGASMTCSADDIARAGGAGPAGYTLSLNPDQTTTKITAADGARWSLTSTYSTHTPTGWAVNAKGDTYGTIKKDGSSPDLVAVRASNGQQGYAYNTDLNPQPMPTSPADALAWQEAHPPTPHTIPVYTSNGTTIIGEFQVN